MNEQAYQQRIAELEQQLSDERELTSQLTSRNHYLEEQFRFAQQKRFGASSEGYSGQGELFNEAEALVVEASESEQENISYTRNKPKRKPLLEGLPREVIVHDIPESEKVCDCCSGELHKLGEDKSEKLEFIPAQVKVIEHIRPKYGCRACEKHGTHSQIKQAPVPQSVIPKG